MVTKYISIFIFFWLATFVVAEPVIDDVHSYWQAQFSLADVKTKQIAKLPHRWINDEATADARRGHYDIALNINPARTNAVLIPKWVMAGKVFFNDVLLHESKQLEEPLSRLWNRPLLAYLPSSAVRPTDNILRIELYTYPGFGFLGPVFSGPREALEPLYHSHVFWQQTINQYFYALSLCTVAFSLLLWFHQRHDTAYIYFSAAALFWSFYNLNLFIEIVPVSAKLWWWWVHSCIEFWAVSVVLFCHRSLGLRKPKLEQAFISLALGTSAIYYFSDLDDFAKTVNTLHLASFGMVAYLVVIQLLHWRQTGERLALYLAGGCFSLLLLGTNDWYMNSPLAMNLIDPTVPFSWQFHFNLVAFGEPLLGATMFWLILKKYSDLAIHVEDLQHNLETKIQQTTEKYKAEKAKTQQLKLNQAAAAERQSVYKSLYEDLADKLSVIYHSATSDTQADAARAAIAELRDTAQTNQQETFTLESVLADVKAEATTRAESANINLVWETLSTLPALHPPGRIVLTIKRVIREAISNILKHANASQILISVNIHNSASQLELVIADNGDASSMATITEGRGLANMKRRAQEIGGALELNTRATGGITIKLLVPC